MSSFESTVAAVDDIRRSTNFAALIVCLTVASVFVVVRTGARYLKLRRVPLTAEDIFIYVALVSHIVMTIMYLKIIPIFYGLPELMPKVLSGELTMAQVEPEMITLMKYFFSVQIFFWLTLWAVKWSLLFMFRRLTEGIQVYERIWWAVLVFTVLTFIAVVITNFTSCSSMSAWFGVGECFTERDTKAKAISMWLALAVDLLTDLLIMAIPIRVLLTLRITTVEKFSIGFVFLVGIITMVAAIIRSVSLYGSINGGQVSTTWLMFWAAVECGIAIIVGCLPSFAIFIRAKIESSKASGTPYISGPFAGVGSGTGQTGKGVSKIQSVKMRSLRHDSIMLDDEADENWKSKNSLASDSPEIKVEKGRGIRVEQGWDQRVDERAEDDGRRERERLTGVRGFGVAF